VMLCQAPVGARLYGLAADRDQGALLIDSIRSWLDRTPAVRGALDVSSYRVTVPATNVTLTILAADAASAWGLRPYFIIVDEIAQWPETAGARRLFEAVRTSVSKANARMVILTTAGDPAHFAFGLLEHARNDPLWRVHEVPGPIPWISQVRLDEQRRALPESSYRRLHLNEWTAPEDRLTTIDDLEACVVLEGPLPPKIGQTYVIGLDVGITNDRTAAAVCHAEPYIRRESDREISGWRVVLDRIRTWEGSRASPVMLSSVREWLEDSSRSYARAKIVIDPYQAVGLAQDLRRAGIIVDEYTFSPSSVGRLAGNLHYLLRNRLFALPRDRKLIEELARVRLVETSPGVLRIDHDAGAHDDCAIAIALAATELLERPTPSPPRLRSLISSDTRRRVGLGH
jgi:phage terminase large subunit-like protein